jgi:rhodanese-related sulfurtransferase
MSDFSVGTEWLHEQMKRGEAIFLVEVRHAGDQDLAVMKARGALRLTDHEAAGRVEEIPKERTVVVYSTAPTDDPAEKLARLLYNNGNNDAHLLAGGWRAYLSAGLPVEQIGEGRNMTRLRGC